MHSASEFALDVRPAEAAVQRQQDLETAATVAKAVRRVEAAEQKKQEVETAGLYICKFNHDSKFT